MPEKKDANELFAESEKYRLDGKHRMQLRRLNQALAEDPHHPEARARRGRALYLKGEKKKGFKDMAQATKLDPNLALAWRLQGQSFLDEGNDKKAYDSLNKAIEFEPDNPRSRFARAEAYHGTFEEMIEDLKLAKANSDDEEFLEEVNQKLAEFYMLWSDDLLEEKGVQGALMAMHAAYETVRLDFYLHHMVDVHQELFEEALAYHECDSKIAPQAGAIQYNMSHIYQELAERCITKAKELGYDPSEDE